jgi:carbon-monoxide dehydrogenase medium subunit
MTTYTELAASAEAKARPILGEVCATIADVQVRNRGTIGGNLCSNDPTNHLPPLMVSIGAQFTITGVAGARVVSADEFFLGVYLTAVGPGELLTKITLPAGKRDAFEAVTLGVDGTCIASAAASVNGSLRIALGCVDATPVLLEPASAGEADVRAAVRSAGLMPPADVHATSEYRLHLAEVLAVRAARHASERS